MPTIEEMKTKMTIFYSKQTGEIKSIVVGIQDMNFFGESKIDFEIIYDFLVVDKDQYVLENLKSFTIINGELKLISTVDLSKYN